MCSNSGSGESSSCVASSMLAVLSSVSAPHCCQPTAVLLLPCAQLWALKADNGDVRIALLNKDLSQSCNFDVRVESWACAKDGTLARLLPGDGSGGMDSKGPIYWQGQTYKNAGYTGKLQGQVRSISIPAKKASDGRLSYVVAMPAASGALLICTK